MQGNAPQQDPVVLRAQARVGQVLRGKWRLDALLGLGGLAAVYVATHRNGKRVAVKMLMPEHCGDAETVTRFSREGYAANAVNHPGAVSVLDDDTTEDGAPFIVMELLEGETLEARWERCGGRLELGEVLFALDQLLDVLGAAHDKGIVHRDIKPDNLFLTRQGQLKVLDFGIARVFEIQRQAKMTQTGSVMGTPAFMAPEQARAKWDMVDGRTDLWAAGATMFFLLTGKFVHNAQAGNDLLILSATKPARSLGSVGNFPRPVIALVDRALAFEREHRWQNAREMQAEVRRVRASLGGAPQQQVPPAAASSGRLDTPMEPAFQSGPQPVDYAREQNERMAEIQRLSPAVDAARQRVAEVRARVAQAQAAVTAVRAERAAHEQLFQRQAGARNAVVGAQRGQLRALMVEFGRRAVEDKQNFGSEHDGSRAEIDRLVRDAEARALAVGLHESAVHAYDKRSVTRGYLAVAAAFGILLLLAAIALAIPWIRASD